MEPPYTAYYIEWEDPKTGARLGGGIYDVPEPRGQQQAKARIVGKVSSSISQQDARTKTVEKYMHAFPF